MLQPNELNFTKAQIADLTPPAIGRDTYRDTKVKGLQLRVSSSGIKTFCVYSRIKNGGAQRITLGQFPILSIEQARVHAQRFLADLTLGIDVAQNRRIARQSASLDISLSEYTLARLCDDYADYLQSLERISHQEVRNLFDLHVKKAFPKITALPAKDVTPEQIADIMRKLLEANKGRTSNKLRTCLHAAYQVARAAKSKPSIPASFKDFGITSNPVSETAPDEAQNRSGKNPLSADELRTYWNIIRDKPGFKAAVLRLHLLTGSQRIAQLVRLRTSHVFKDEILLFDGKGRPGRPPRQHPLPLIPTAAQALKDCHPQGEYALSTDGGETHLAPTTLSDWAVEIAAGAIENFQAKRLRSGVETLLSRAKISKEVRGRLQSHGIGGVQDHSYDGNDYMDQKLEALTMLYRLLEPSQPQKKPGRSQRRDLSSIFSKLKQQH